MVYGPSLVVRPVIWLPLAWPHAFFFKFFSVGWCGVFGYVNVSKPTDVSLNVSWDIKRNCLKPPNTWELQTKYLFGQSNIPTVVFLPFHPHFVKQNLAVTLHSVFATLKTDSVIAMLRIEKD